MKVHCESLTEVPTHRLTIELSHKDRVALDWLCEAHTSAVAVPGRRSLVLPLDGRREAKISNVLEVLKAIRDVL